MDNIVLLINSLPDLLALKPATETQITDAEIQLRVNFSEEYKKYILKFGAIIADGIELTGIANSEHRNVVNITKKEKELNKKVPSKMYVIENTGVDGIVVWQDSEGTIYQSSPNIEPEQIAGSLYEYISSRYKK